MSPLNKYHATWLRPLVAGFPLWWPGFNPRLDHVGSMLDKVTLGQVFSNCFGFPCQFSFHEMLHAVVSSGAATADQHTKWTQSHPTPRDKMNSNKQTWTWTCSTIDFHHRLSSHVCSHILKSDMRRNRWLDETSCTIQYQSYASCTLWKNEER
jgi:hypothetical protein